MWASIFSLSVTIFLSAQAFLPTVDLPIGLLLASNRVEQDGVYSNPDISSGIDLYLPLLPLHSRVRKTLVKKTGSHGKCSCAEGALCPFTFTK